MARQKMITQDAMRKAQARPLGVHPGNRFYTQRRESFFFDYVKQELINRYGVEEVRQGGLKVHTTIDLKLQQAARAAIRDTLTFANPPSSAIVTIDPSNGHILAMASSADYGRSKFNLAAQGRRQPGSTFKVDGPHGGAGRRRQPVDAVHVAAAELRGPQVRADQRQDLLEHLQGPHQPPEATLASDNSVYQQLALDLGPDKVKEAARAMGIKSKLNAYPSEVLGGLEDGVSPLEMANAYATIAYGGLRNTADRDHRGRPSPTAA